MAPAGVFFAGWGFTNRDWLQDVWGKRAVIIAILVGALLFALLSPTLALASASAFLLSELLDFAIYTPLKAKHWLGAVVVSNTLGAVIDSVVFLWLAFGSLDFFLGQFVGKSYVTLVFVGLVYLFKSSTFRKKSAA